jgi:DNA recombination protein RmuC
MSDPLLLAFLFLLCGLFIGMGLAWLVSKLQFQKNHLPKSEVETNYIHKGLYTKLEEQHRRLQDILDEKEEALRVLNARLSAEEQVIFNLENRLDEQQGQLRQQEERARIEFENLANRLLEEKSHKFTLQNQEQLHHILNPLKEKIKTFEEGIERRFLEETKDRISLKKEIEQLRALNQQLSSDANNLASALKGDNKIQGDWGEIQLERLLEKAGLSKGIHYAAQPSFSDNGQQKRPDFVIYLPEDKQLVIDAKVSLKAYDQFCHANDEQERKAFLKNHIDSIKQHVKSLSSKNYQQLYQINSPDYLLLFIPIEPAFALAIQEDNRLFVDALDQNIVIVSSSTLLATMRTVSFIWKQEKQKNNVLEIARQSGFLYDKFCNFVGQLEEIGQRLGQAQNAYQDAMKKLTTASRPGDTLIGKAEQIRKLGARASKKLPSRLLDQIDDEDNPLLKE